MSRRTNGIAVTVTIQVFALLLGMKRATAEHSVTDRSVASVTSPASSRKRRRIPPPHPHRKKLGGRQKKNEEEMMMIDDYDG